jgi:hypothetical protein
MVKSGIVPCTCLHWTMPTLELVVAHYQEDLAWLRRVPDVFGVTVYDKGGDAPHALRLPNVGREAHSYLHHLVTRYDSLADITVFCQGRPFDHVPDFRRRLKRLAAGGAMPPGFEWWGFVIDWDDETGSRLFQNWSKNPERHTLDMDGFCRALWDQPATPPFVFFAGAHFAVTAAAAQARSREWYERAFAISSDFPDAAHAFERCWDRIFACDGIPPDIRDRSMPVFLRPVRRLGLTWHSVPERYRGW